MLAVPENFDPKRVRPHKSRGAANFQAIAIHLLPAALEHL
jgi:hypothetical protein